MLKEKLWKLILRHWNKFKIWWLIFAIIAMIVAVRTYINYTTIQDAIRNVENSIENWEQEIAYTNQFLKKYLDSDYADYFLAHKNNILFDWEYIIRFESPKENENNKEEVKDDNLIETPQESRRHFIKSKINNW